MQARRVHRGQLVDAKLGGHQLVQQGFEEILQAIKFVLSQFQPPHDAIKRFHNLTHCLPFEKAVAGDRYQSDC